MNGVRAALQGPKFAVIRLQETQHRIVEGDRVQTSEPFWADIGESVKLKKVLMIGGEQFTAIGRPLLANAWVTATVEEHFRSKLQYQFKKRANTVWGGRWVDISMPSSILRIGKIHFEPEMKVEGQDAFYPIKNLSQEEAEELEAEEDGIEPVKWSTMPNGPSPMRIERPTLAPDVADFVKWRKMEQIQNLDYHQPGMRYWWWPKDKFESGYLGASR
ncbi:50S ribosomal protein L21 [Diplonema papillatum]|nr:50S ribosomal protein L21 [Diplonema papillatum]